ncbi:MAG: type VI secretion system contractile sheath large subunit [Ectothiorhodospiraceae bacterium]|nr:type VI secretion system contractile sheath large subunit [Ectothiorhodospiraceae bacterium]
MTNQSQQNIERVNLVYRSGDKNTGIDVELPFRALVLGDFTQSAASEFFDEQSPISVTVDNINDVIKGANITLTLNVRNCLIDDESADHLTISLPITALSDFEPHAIVKNVPYLAKLATLRKYILAALEGDSDTKNNTGLNAHIESDEDIAAFVQRFTFDDEFSQSSLSILVTDIDDRLSAQMDEIIHHEHFESLESAWRALHFLVERTPFDENCTVEILDLSKQALLENFEDVPETIQSQLYHIVYSSEFGQFGGRPYSVIIGNYDFSPSAPDMRLLQQLAAVSSISHAPFIAAASPEFFDIDNFSGLTRLRDLSAIFEQPRFAKWNSFRESEDARYIGLTLPGFLLRAPYESDVDGAFNYQERYDKNKVGGLWGNCAFAFASRLLDSYSQYRWCLNISGAQDGKVDGLNMSNAANSHRSIIPTRVLISDRRESELVKYGFIPLSVRKGSDTAAFYSAQSVQSAKVFADTEEGRASTLNHLLGGQFPYLFIVSRLSHYLKMMQRENIGSWKTRLDIDKELNNWLRQYISDMDNPTPAVRARRPLRKAQVKIREVEGKSGWYLIKLVVVPHLKYMGESFSLNETGKLDLV